MSVRFKKLMKERFLNRIGVSNKIRNTELRALLMEKSSISQSLLESPLKYEKSDFYGYKDTLKSI